MKPPKPIAIIFGLLYITLFHARVVFSWSFLKINPPSIPHLSPPSTLTITDILLPHQKPFHSILLSSTILISSQFPHHANAAATLPIDISQTKQATTTITHLTHTNIFLSSSSLQSKSASTNGNIDIDLQQLEQSLAKPTNERPQIQLPTNFNDKIGQNKNDKITLNFNNQNEQIQPFIQGLIYLLDTNDRPNLSDNIVITVTSTENPELVIAGAKYPVSKARFPFQFRLYRANILLNDKLLDPQIQDQDLIVMARICPIDTEPAIRDDENYNEMKGVNQKKSPKIPCQVNESTFLAKGISKAIANLPGMEQGTTLRTAASLPLERTGRQNIMPGK